LQAQTLSLSALLRSADGLDYSQSQTTHIADLKITPDTITLHLTGPCAETDGERAVVKADLWLEVFGQAWRLAPDVAQLAQQPLAAQTPVSRVIVRALADQLVRWEAAQPAAIAGDAPALKAMRAAARRARAGLGLFEPFVKKKVIKSLRVRLKQAEKMLGAVRDWDVLLIAAQAELGEAAFIEQWRGERVTALQDAERWLASAEAGELRAAWEAILAEPPIRAKYDTPLVDNAEFILLTPVETLRTLAAALNVADLETYHALRRVGIKRVRFALEFLAPALGPQADEVLKEIVKAQDRLGFLNDACVMREKLIHWLAQHPEDEVARQYASACEAAIQTHLRKFARDWAAVQPDILTGKLRALLWPRPAIG
jgi:CHAD domain-containing protein